MCIGDRLAFFYKTADNIADVLADLDKFFYFKSAIEKLFLKFFCGNIYIYIFF